MATNPTKLQHQAKGMLADALNLVAEAARLDGRSPIDAQAWAVLASQVVRASSAFGLDAIVALALERRAVALGVAATTAEMLTLAESKVRPLDMLRLPDDEFLALAATLDADLGDL